MKHILITGGNGYIGQYAVQHFTSAGYRVTVTLRDPNCNYTDAQARQMDLLDTSTIEDVCRGIDVVIHTATMDERKIAADSKQALLANAYATRILYMDAQKHGVTDFLYLSTFHVYGVSSGAVDELIIPNPKTDYALTHFMAELYLNQLSQSSATHHAIMRLTNGISAPMLGVDKWYLVVNDFCKTLYETGKIVMRSNGLPLRDFIAIPDVVAAMEILVQTSCGKNLNQVYNVSSNDAISIRNLLNQVAEIYHCRYGKIAQIQAPSVSQQEINAVASLRVCNDKLKKLGWQPQMTVNDVINGIFDSLEKNNR